MLIPDDFNRKFQLKKITQLITVLLFCLVLVLAGLTPASPALAAPNEAPLAQGAACTPGTVIRPLTLANSFPSTCDDCSADNQTLGFNVNFLGNNRANITVTSNGYLRFGNLGSTVPFTPFPMSDSTYVIMAAAFADVDLHGGGSISYGQTTVDGQSAYAVTYDNVGYFNSHGDLRNTFQVVLINRGGGDFDLEYNYGQIQWETGDANGGVSGLGGTSMVAGFSAGDGVHYAEFPGSLVNGGLLDSNLSTGLVNNSLNSTICGRYVMEMRSGTHQDAPTAVADSYTASRNATLNVAAPGVLDNDTDPQNDSLSAILTSGPAHGTLTLNSDGSFTYTPTTGYTGSDSFRYQANDGYFSSNVITSTLTVNNNTAPEITEGDAITVTMSEDGSPTAFSLTLHALDINLDTLTWSLQSGPSSGTADATGSGDSLSPTYIPPADFYGSDSFVVLVEDGYGGSDTITVNVTVEAVNDDPVITEGASTLVTMDEDGSPTAFSLTLNATDIDSDPADFSWSISGAASHGTAGVDPSGASPSVTYTPVLNYTGFDTFNVEVDDGAGGTDTITVNVSIDPVNDPPVITEGDTITVTMSEDGSPVAFSLTLNATDVDTAPASLSWTLLSDPSDGLATASGTGDSVSPTYTPDTNFNGSDSFVVQVEDSDGATDTITVEVVVEPVNDPPVITEGETTSVTMDEDGSPTDFNLTLHATDVDNDAASLSWSITSDPGNGTANVDPSGDSPSVTYTPDANYNGLDSFEVQVNDGAGGTDTITVEVTVDPVNDPPVITEGESVTVDMDEDSTPTPFSLTLHATDVELDTLTWSLFSDASHGSATAAGTGDSLDVFYTPEADFTGTDSFVVQVADPNGGSDTIEVVVQVAGTNDLPLVTAGDDQQVVEGETVSFNGSYTDPDGPGSPDILWEFGDGDTASGTLTPEHVYQDNGTYNVRLTVTDESNLPVSSELLVTVSNANPQLDPLPDAQIEVEQLYQLSATFSDPGAEDTHTAQVDWGDGSQEAAGIVTGIGVLQASHTYLAEGTFTVLVTLWDDDGGEDTGQFAIEVTPPAEPFQFRIIIPVIVNNWGH